MRVLIIDDNELVLEIFLTLARFSHPEWQVRYALGHDLGFVIANEFMPHVICADIGRMPKPGLAFGQQIRRNKTLKNVFLIAITGWGDVHTHEQIDTAGFDVRLTKPVGYELFTQHIHAFALTRSLLM